MNLISINLDLKSGHSTSLCTGVLKRTVDYYINKGSHVFACFVDFSKAFDNVNYWKLFNKLLDDNISSSIIRVLAYWYSNQEVCVRWHSTISIHFQLVMEQGKEVCFLLFCLLAIFVHVIRNSLFKGCN